jgi:GNAT superfamily N-acetyltransferase
MTAFSDADIESIERATVDAVAPEAVVEWNGWLLPFDHGTISRAKAAVPLRHARVLPDVIDVIDTLEARYAEQHLPCTLRIADVPAFAPLIDELQRRGYVGAGATLVQTASARRVRQVSSGVAAAVDRQSDAGWAALFVGEGSDPIDGAARARALGRAPDSRFASVRKGGRTLACGTLALGHGWGGILGMRTDAAHRGQGLASQVLASIAQAALAQGLEQLFLQVEEHNSSAHALYRRAGFATAWRYRYWQRA